MIATNLNYIWKPMGSQYSSQIACVNTFWVSWSRYSRAVPSRIHCSSPLRSPKHVYCCMIPEMAPLIHNLELQKNLFGKICHLFYKQVSARGSPNSATSPGIKERKSLDSVSRHQDWTSTAWLVQPRADQYISRYISSLPVCTLYHQLTIPKGFMYCMC